MTVKLENWSVVKPIEDPYTPPELIPERLAGEVYGDNNREDGTRIVSSAIVSAEGRIVTTASGSTYELGEPEERYVQWCRDEGVHVPTKDKPIIVHHGTH
jgi:hypothetical protein